jgi:predicted DNA-binding transcriptional regulator AlpA
MTQVQTAERPARAKRGSRNSERPTVDREPLVDPEAVATYLNLFVKTLENWRGKGEGPRFIRVSPQCVRYRWSDVDAWLDQNTVETEAA